MFRSCTVCAVRAPTHSLSERRPLLARSGIGVRTRGAADTAARSRAWADIVHDTMGGIAVIVVWADPATGGGAWAEVFFDIVSDAAGA